jgi:hypothetical protein
MKQNGAVRSRADKMSPEFTNTKTSRQVPLKVETKRAPFDGINGASPPRNTAASLIGW